MPYLGYCIILLICVGVCLVSLNRVSQRTYPYLLFAMGASMALITSLSATNTVLGDTHLEYYYARLHLGAYTWAPIVNIPQEATIGSIYLAPWLSKIFQIPLIWVFKLVYPLMFASVPVILFFVFRRWIDIKKAFMASFIFIAFPAFFLELPVVTRQMLAEVVLATLLYLIIVSKLRWKWKIPILVLCGALLAPIHYSTGLISIVILGVALVASLVLRRGAYTKSIVVVLITLLMVSTVYFSLTGGRSVVFKVESMYNQFVPAFMEITVHEAESPKPLPDRPPLPPDRPIKDYYGNLMQAGLGFDFVEVGYLAKIFRILQWIMFIAIGVGLWCMRRNREYWVFTSGFLLVTILCLVPGWAGLLNPTRFVHFSLFMLAPAFVVGGTFLLRKEYLLLAFLIPYFLFASGFVFEITKQPNVERVNIPYSVGLSDHRMDLGATFTEDDAKVRRYILENNLFPLTSDVFASYFMQDLMGSRKDSNDVFDVVPANMVIRKGYIFIRSRNIQDGTVTVWFGIGCRKFIPLESYGVDWDSNVVFQSGDARVLEVK